MRRAISIQLPSRYKPCNITSNFCVVAFKLWIDIAVEDAAEIYLRRRYWNDEKGNTGSPLLSAGLWCRPES